MKFEAGMHGINIDKVEKEVHEQSTSHLLFDDPANYEKLSDEEKEIRTRQMMKYHKGWVSKTSLKGK